MKFFFGFLLTSILSNIVSAEGNLFQKGQNFYQQGNFVQAVEVWETALQNGDVPQFNTLLRLSSSYQALGNYNSALNVVRQAISVAQTPEQEVLSHTYLADILLALQQPDASFAELEKYLPTARTLDDQLILANVLNNMGNTLSSEKYYLAALPIYQEVVEIAERSNNVLLQIQALNNQAQIYLKQDKPKDSILILEKNLSLLAQLPDDHTKAFYLLSLGQLVVKLQTSVTSPKLNPYDIFTKVLSFADQFQNQRLVSYAKGFLGKLYEQKQEYPAALKLTREAIFIAQDLPDLLYLWEWQ
ncbi:MAG: tetratricopeptide repeat protein, partial [Candidatus Marithrix sp.]|nr:tetratricopeptide repeat protein [Candidatus Marithrix sp.]